MGKVFGDDDTSLTELGGDVIVILLGVVGFILLWLARLVVFIIVLAVIIFGVYWFGHDVFLPMIRGV